MIITMDKDKTMTMNMRKIVMKKMMIVNMEMVALKAELKIA